MRQWFEKFMDWAISSQGLMRTRFNDYPYGSTSIVSMEMVCPCIQGEDIVWTSVKAEDAFWRCDSKKQKSEEIYVSSR